MASWRDWSTRRHGEHRPDALIHGFHLFLSISAIRISENVTNQVREVGHELIALVCNPRLTVAFVDLSTLPASGQSGTLEVSLDGLRNIKGSVYVCIWRPGQADFPKCSNSAKGHRAAVGSVQRTEDRLPRPATRQPTR